MMVQSQRIVDRDCDTKKVDKGLKNTWKWEWLERKVGDELVGRFLRKLNSRGIAFCELCSKNISYSTSGWKALQQHILKKVHIENKKIKATNQSLSGKHLLLHVYFTPDIMTLNENCVDFELDFGKILI